LIGANDIEGTTGSLTFTGASTYNIADNTTSALTLQDGTGSLDYLLITTIDGAETMTFGHSTVDSFTFTSDNNAAGDVGITGGLTVTSAGTHDSLTVTSSVDTEDGLQVTANSLTTGNAIDVAYTGTTGSGLRILDSTAADANAMVFLSNTAADATAQTYLIQGRYADTGDAEADFLLFEDAGGTDQFVIGQDGDVTITGIAEGTSALTLTGGDITLTDGDVVLTAGDLTVTSGSVAFTQEATGSATLTITSLDNATTGPLDLNVQMVSGTIIDVDYSAETLTGALTGISLDLSTNVTEADVAVTGVDVLTPTLTAAASTTYIAYNNSASGLLQTTDDVGNETATWRGMNVSIPAVTHHADVGADDADTIDVAGILVSAGTVTAGDGTTVSTGVDVSDADIDNALLIGANDIEGTDATITFTDFTVAAEGLTTISPDGAGDALTLALAAADSQGIVINGASNVNASTDGVLDMNLETVANLFEGINMDLQVNDDGGADTVIGQLINIDNNATTADDTVYALQIISEDSGGVDTDLVADSLIYLQQADTQDPMANLIFADVAAGGVTSAIDVSDAQITNAMSVGDNTITGGAAVIDFTSFDVASTGATDIETSLTIDTAAVQAAVTRLCSTVAGGDGLALNDAVVADCDDTSQADFAEIYPVAQGVTYGHIVAPGSQMVTSTGESGHGVYEIAQLELTTKAYQEPVAGIVSNNYHEAATVGYDIREENNPMPVALVGRVPVNVTNENGTIAVGDFITTSSTPGYGMKATEAGRVVGMALGSFDGESGQVMVQVLNTWYQPSSGSELQGGDSTVLVLSTFTAESLEVTDGTFNGSVTVKEHLYGSSDMAGRARIASGDTVVHVDFTKEYEVQPIVVATPRIDASSLPSWWLNEESTDGFDIVLAGALESDVEFNWIAMGVENGKVSVSDGSVEDIQVYVLPTEEAAAVVPVPVVEEAASVAVEEVVAEPVVEEPAPVVEETVVSEPAADPALVVDETAPVSEPVIVEETAPVVEESVPVV
jgi:hypothetical protein